MMYPSGTDPVSQKEVRSRAKETCEKPVRSGTSKRAGSDTEHGDILSDFGISSRQYNAYWQR